MATNRNTISRVLSQIPAWTRAALVLVGLAGVVVIVVASLMGHQEQTIKVDKLLHFGGYAALALIFVLGLRPKFYLPAMVVLAALSIAIEYLQPFNSRSFDPADMVANLCGLATGLAFGVVLRIAGRMIQTQRLQRARRRFSPGAIIIQQNAAVKSCYLIEKGEVQLTREVGGQGHVLGKLGPGELFSILGLLQSKPQYATVEAVTDTTVISLDIEFLCGTAHSESDPVHGVLLAMAKQLRASADRVVEAEKVVT